MPENRPRVKKGGRRKSKRPERKPFLLRLSPELMEELKKWSSQEFRSLNGHVEYLLQNAVKQRKGQNDTKEKVPQ